MSGPLGDMPGVRLAADPWQVLFSAASGCPRSLGTLPGRLVPEDGPGPGHGPRRERATWKTLSAACVVVSDVAVGFI